MVTHLNIGNMNPVTERKESRQEEREFCGEQHKLIIPRTKFQSLNKRKTEESKFEALKLGTNVNLKDDLSVFKNSKLQSPVLEKMLPQQLIGSDTILQNYSQSLKLCGTDQLLDSLNHIIRDEALVFKLCYDQNKVKEHMK